MNKAPLKIRDGRTVDAITPVILSASRSTDIPAYYAKWFIERIREGYAACINPHDLNPSYVSFEKTRVIVFWTKNPEPLHPYLSILDDMGLNYYFQFTLNDYHEYGNIIEKHVPSLSKRLDTFARLYEHVGSKRIIWRYDPIMLNDTDLTVETHLEKINNIGKQLRGMTDKLVFSFADVKDYRNVLENLVRLNLYTHCNVLSAEPDCEQKNTIARGISELRAGWKKYLDWDVTVATCAEGIDLSSFGIEHNRCIDPDLIDELFCPKDPALRAYLDCFRNRASSEKRNDRFQNELFSLGSTKVQESMNETKDNRSQNELFSCDRTKSEKKAGDDRSQFDMFSFSNQETMDKTREERFNYKKFKDKTQRPACGCVTSTDIGMCNTCLHQCAYCYNNTSNEHAMNNHKFHRTDDESIIPFNISAEWQHNLPEDVVYRAEFDPFCNEQEYYCGSFTSDLRTNKYDDEDIPF
jgi:DNA repair photolyase